MEMNISQIVPNYKEINKKISLSLGFKSQMVMIPIANSEENNGESVEKPVWVLRDAENFVWYVGKRIVAKEDQVVEMIPALSEEEMWNRDCPDYYSDSNLAFSLLPRIPYHTLRVVESDVGSMNAIMWEITYRHKANGPTYTEVGQFVTICIVNVFMECNIDTEPEINVDIKTEPLNMTEF